MKIKSHVYFKDTGNDILDANSGMVIGFTKEGNPIVLLDAYREKEQAAGLNPAVVVSLDQIVFH